MGRSIARRLAVVALVGFLVSGCRGGGDVGDVDAEEVLEAAATRMQAVESFHFRLEHRNGSTEIVRGLQMVSAEGDVAGTDRLRLDVRAMVGPLNVDISIVILPDESFITNPLTGRWERESISVAQLFDPASGVTALMRSATDAKATGRERVGNTDTYVIEANVDSGDLALFAAGAAPGRTLQAKAWIGVDDPLVHRVEVLGATSELEAENLLRRLELSRFGEAIEITAPR